MKLDVMISVIYSGLDLNAESANAIAAALKAGEAMRKYFDGIENDATRAWDAALNGRERSMTEGNPSSTTASKLLERLDELEKAATPGPWEFVNYSTDSWGSLIAPRAKSNTFDSLSTGKLHQNNAQLICELRNAYPKLRAVVEAALEEVDYPQTKLRKALEAFEGDPYGTAQKARRT